MSVKTIMCQVVPVEDSEGKEGYGVIMEGKNRTDWGMFPTMEEAVMFCRGWVEGSATVAEDMGKRINESSGQSAAAALQLTIFKVQRDQLAAALRAVIECAKTNVPNATLAAELGRAESALSSIPRAH